MPHGRRVAKAHLGLGRVHVGIDQCRVDGQEQREYRIAFAVQAVAVGLADGLRQHAVTYEAAVDEQVLPVRTGTGGIGRTQQTLQRQRAGLGGDGQQPVAAGAAIAHQGLDALAWCGGGPAADFLAVLVHDELHVRVRERNAADHVQAVGGFGGR